MTVEESGGFGIQFDTQNVVTTGVFTGNEFVGQRLFADLNSDGNFEQVRSSLEDTDGDFLSDAVTTDVNQTVFFDGDADGILTGISDASGNLQPGVGGIVDGGGVNLTFGSLDLASDSNLFDGNGDAHIGLVFQNDSVNTVEVLNSVLVSADDAQNSVLPDTFDGDGIAFDVRDSSTLAGRIEANKIVGNLTDGIDMRVGGNSLAEFGSINDFVIASNRITGNGRVLAPPAELGSNGIQLIRTSTGEINNMQILGNVVDRNADKRPVDRCLGRVQS